MSCYVFDNDDFSYVIMITPAYYPAEEEIITGKELKR